MLQQLWGSSTVQHVGIETGVGLDNVTGEGRAAMSDIWTKALRGGPTTARTKSYGNNRYGSKGPDDVEDSADSGQKRTPRQASMYDRPWKDLVSRL